jgi:hypothetical protein
MRPPDAKSRAAPGRPAPTMTTAAAKRAEVISTIAQPRDSGPPLRAALGASVIRPGCSWCGDPLPARRRRFCSDEHRRKGHRAERKTENDDYAKSVVRQIRSMGVRASADLYALAWLSAAVDHARTALDLAVDGCRSRGYSDAEIGAALGITRQAVGQRFGRKRDVYTGPDATGLLDCGEQ